MHWFRCNMNILSEWRLSRSPCRALSKKCHKSDTFLAKINGFFSLHEDPLSTKFYFSCEIYLLKQPTHDMLSSCGLLLFQLRFWNPMSLVYFSTFQMEARIFPYMLFVAIFFSSASAEKCKDTDTRCEGWANIGECTKNPIWMGRNCRKSCNKCEDDKCKDTRTEADCTFWQAQYYCHKSSRWHGFMKENCQKTCKFCGAKLPGLCASNFLTIYYSGLTCE